MAQAIAFRDTDAEVSVKFRFARYNGPMSEISDELLEIAQELDSIQAEYDSPEIKAPLQKLENAANGIGKAWSGSWLGYHSRVYYRDFQTPPAGAHFSQEWGLMQYFTDGTTGEWREYEYDRVQKKIYELAGEPDLEAARALAKRTRNLISDKQTEIASLISTAQENKEDSFISKLRKDVEEIAIPTATNIVNGHLPQGKFISRDTVAIGQGFQSPPHLDVWADVIANRVPSTVCETLSRMAKQAAAHLVRREPNHVTGRAVGNNVFIGHGRSAAWRDLREFIQDRLGLSWDEFNRVPIAGITNTARLSQMLDDAGIAFLILTAEDEKADGTIQARMNVIHEAGLFQGRLGFTKAIILLEDGCEEFSNIKGLGQIRFPKGDIKQAFEEIRRVLEREGLLTP